MWWIGAALAAGQTEFEVTRTDIANTYEFHWKDEAGRRHDARFALPAPAVQADNAAPRKPPLDEMSQHQARIVRQWARDLEGVELTVTATGAGLEFNVSGRDKGRMKRVLTKAQALAEEAADDWLLANDVMTMEGGGLSMDHAKLVPAYVDDVAPVAAAIPGADPRAWADNALAFVQAIPYEIRADGADKGFRRPLSVIDRNKGDCDSKSTLFLAMLAAAHPGVESAMVYVPGHALVALALPPRAGDDTVEIRGRDWILAEPVGPAEYRVGETGTGHARQAKRGEIHMVER